MIISFFSEIDYTTGVDYSNHESLVFQDDLDFNPETQTAELVEEDWNFSIKISEKPEEQKVESFQEKRTRVFQKFIEAETLEDFDWEGIEPTEQDYNNLIVLRNFSGDAGSQVTMLTKAVFKILAILLEKKVIPIEELAMIFQEDLQKTQEISETRVALGLNPFDFSFLGKK